MGRRPRSATVHASLVDLKFYDPKANHQLGDFDFVLGPAETVELEFGRGTRPAEQIPLCMRAARDAQEQELIFRFDAFGNGADAKTSAEARHRRHDRGAVLTLGELMHKEPIDL